jgi:transcriptional activator SPT7
MTAALAIEKKLPPWLQLTYVLAKQLQKTNAADTFLTQDEAEYFNQSLGSFQHWCRFIQPDPALDSKPHLNQDQMAAFRVRAMLCEQFIPHFFHSDRPCCRKLKLDLNQLSLEANELNEVAATVATLSITSNSPKPTIKNEQEPFEEQTQEEEQPPSQRNTDHVPLLDIYHTLEFDMAAMIEQRKLEAYHAQEEAHEHEKEDIDTTVSICMLNITLACY